MANPKYTGHMVYGRHRTTAGGRQTRPVPPEQWIWSPGPTHPAIITRQTWETAQRAGAQHGTSRDTTTPTSRSGRAYVLRSRCRCTECGRRMTGRLVRPHPAHDGYVYYHCPHNPKNPRHAAAAPSHPTTVQVREDALLTRVAGFFATRIFGPGRASLLAAALPADAAAQTARRDAETAALAKREQEIDAAEHALTREIEALGHLPTDAPALTALRSQIVARFTELETERTQIKQHLTALNQAAQHDQDPTLLDDLPVLGDILTGTPPATQARLIQALDTELLYSKTGRKLTMRATITPHTRAAFAAIIEPSQPADIGAGQAMSPLSQAPRFPWWRPSRET